MGYPQKDNKYRNSINQHSIIRSLWCEFFHSRYRHRTGNRTIRRSFVFYEVICDRCGIEDVEMERLFIV